MKVLIQDAVAETYLMSDGGWTPLVKEGRDFATMARATLFAQANVARKCRVIAYFPNEDLCVNMSEAKAAGAPANPN